MWCIAFAHTDYMQLMTEQITILFNNDDLTHEKKENNFHFLPRDISTQSVKSSKSSILTKSLAFTEAPLSQRSFTLEEQPAMTVKKKSEKKKSNCNKFSSFITGKQRNINPAQQ